MTRCLSALTGCLSAPGNRSSSSASTTGQGAQFGRPVWNGDVSSLDLLPPLAAAAISEWAQLATQDHEIAHAPWMPGPLSLRKSASGLG